MADRKRRVRVGAVALAGPARTARAGRAPSPRARVRRTMSRARSWPSTIRSAGSGGIGVSAGGSTPKCASASGARSTIRRGSRVEPDGQDRHLGVAGLERAVAAAAEVAAAGQVGRARPREAARPAARPRSGSRGRPTTARARRAGPAAMRRRSSASRRRPERTAAPRRSRRATASSPSRKSTTSAAGEPSSRRASSAALFAAAGQPVDHPGAVRSGHEDVADPR